MSEAPRRRAVAFVIAASAIVLVSRVPFLTPGYGVDPDAWRTASAARLIAETGVYHESRSPGHPVQEWTCSWLWRGGPTAVNGATAIASALAALFFGLAFLELGGGLWSAAAALALGFTPIVYIHSVDAMDYLWALCFSMAALWLVTRRHWLGAAVAVGLAVGSRATAGLVLLPLLALAWARGGTSPRKLAGFVALAVVVGAACYLPDFLARGPGFLHVAEGPYPGLARLLQDTTLELWGTIGGLGLAAAFLLGRRGRSAPVLAGSPGIVLGSLLAIALYFAAFLTLPDEPAYLIPAIPFVILLLARWARPASFAGACACLVLSPFVMDLGRPYGPPRAGEIALPSGHPVVIVRPLEGALLVDRKDRKTGVAYGEQVLAAAREARKPAVVVCYAWQPQIDVMVREAPPADVRFAYFVRAGEADSLVRSGANLYYLPGSESANRYYEHVDLDSLGAHPLGIAPHP